MKDDKKIKDLRVLKGYTVSEMAEKLGVKETYVYMMEAGSRNVSLKMAKKYAEIFNASLDEILELKKEA